MSGYGALGSFNHCVLPRFSYYSPANTSTSHRVNGLVDRDTSTVLAINPTLIVIGAVTSSPLTALS